MEVRSTKALVPAVALLLLLLAGSACQLVPGFLGQTPVPTPTFPGLPPLLTPATPEAPATSLPLPGPILVSQEFQESGSSPDYTIKLSYPFLQGCADPHFDLFNAQVDLLVKSMAAGFKKDLAAYLATPDPNTTAGSFLDSSYSVPYGQSGLISVVFRVGYYMSGAAHPNSYFVTLNLDLNQQKALTLADLMQPGVDYLGPISAYCIQGLEKQGLMEADVTVGAAAKAENYRNWSITPTGLDFAFDPYQVAAYALGPQKVSIPYSALKQILNPNGPLAGLIK